MLDAAIERISPRSPRTQAVWCFLFLIAFGIYPLKVFHLPDEGAVWGDGGLIIYTITENIERAAHGNFRDWTNRLIFYPNRNTFSYTDHFYLHSLLGFPIYLLTGDPIRTFNYVDSLRILIAAAGYVFLIRRFSKSYLAIIAGGLYFLYLPTFIERHPHINFYAFLPWFVAFVLLFFETRKIRYVYLSAGTFLLQALAGIYLQLFLFTFAPILILVLVVHNIRKHEAKFLTGRVIISILISAIAVGFILYRVNIPYLEFKKEVGIVRNLMELQFYSADMILSYFVPNGPGNSYLKLVPALQNLPRIIFEKSLFIGFSGIIAALAAIYGAAFRRDMAETSRNLVRCCLLFLLLMGWFSLGPTIHVWRLDTGIPGLYGLLYRLSFVFRSIRVTSRIICLMSLPLSILVSWFIDSLQNSTIRISIKRIAIPAIVVLLFLDLYAPRYRFVDPELRKLPYIYQKVNTSPGPTLLELPSGWSCINLKMDEKCNPAVEGYYEYMHIFHHKWTISGASGYNPPNSILVVRKIDVNYYRPRHLMENFIQNNIAIVLIHKRFIDKNYADRFKVFITGLLRFSELVYEDENYVLVSVLPNRYR